MPFASKTKSSIKYITNITKIYFKATKRGNRRCTSSFKEIEFVVDPLLAKGIELLEIAVKFAESLSKMLIVSLA